MRTINGTLQTRLSLGTTSLCHIFTITRKDGTIFRFTDLDVDLVIGAETFVSSNSLAVSGITTTSNNGIQSTNCTIIFDDSGITEEDMIRGLFDDAGVEFAVVDYEFTAGGRLILLTGLISTMEITDKGRGTIEVRGLLSRADSRIGEYYSAECRADLGDSRCTVNLASHTDTGVVTEVVKPNQLKVDFAGNPANGHYTFGVITWTSGDNITISMEVINQYAHDADEDMVFLALRMPYDVQVGDTFSIVAGCDKRTVTCRTKFNNIVNFRGEPFVPGSDMPADLKKT